MLANAPQTSRLVPVSWMLRNIAQCAPFIRSGYQTCAAVSGIAGFKFAGAQSQVSPYFIIDWLSMHNTTGANPWTVDIIGPSAYKFSDAPIDIRFMLGDGVALAANTAYNYTLDVPYPVGSLDGLSINVVGTPADVIGISLHGFTAQLLQGVSVTDLYAALSLAGLRPPAPAV